MLKKITQDSDFNEMMEFIKEEVISLMTAQQILKEEQEEILPIMKENYDGYKFSIDAKQRENCIALEGNIDKVINLLHVYLNNLSNRDYQGFDEKYVKLIFFCIAMNLKFFRVKSEMEVNRKYPDLLLIPRQDLDMYYGAMIEFKYLKKGEKNKLEEKQKEAKKQIEEYSNFEEIKSIPKLKKYTVIAVNDEIFVEEII